MKLDPSCASCRRRQFLQALGLFAIGESIKPTVRAEITKIYVVVIGHTGRRNYGHGSDIAFQGFPSVEVVGVAEVGPTGLEAAT